MTVWLFANVAGICVSLHVGPDTITIQPNILFLHTVLQRSFQDCLPVVKFNKQNIPTIMGLIYFIFNSVGRAIDFLCFILDLNFCIVSSLLSFLFGIVYFVYSLPTLLTTGLFQCWNLSLICVLTTIDTILGVAQGSFNMVGSWFRVFCGVPESFKMVGHLFSHVLLRTKELFHRGLLSGHSFFRQICDGCGIALSLIVYLVNTVVNILLIGTQNCFAVVLAAWEAVSGPVQKILELTLALFSYLSSSLVGTAILLWTPCQLALEFLRSLSQIFVSVFLLNLYGLLLTLAIVAMATLYVNPGLARRVVERTLRYMSTVPSLSRLQRTVHRLYLLVLARTQAVLLLEIWQRVVRRGSRTGQAAGSNRADTGPVDAQGPPEAVRAPLPPPPPLPPPQPQNNNPDPPPGTSSRDRPLKKHLSGDGDKVAPQTELLSLLKEHEERKKCVICQDSVKTVLLLPCRHLCLCRDCTDIFLRQPIHQHNCPLCRHMILQTMDVFL